MLEFNINWDELFYRNAYQKYNSNFCNFASNQLFF